MIEERFHFYKLDEKLPPEHVPVLIKFKDIVQSYYGDVKYYVCYMIRLHTGSDESKIVFCEALGEEYSTFDADDIDSWALLEEEENGRQKALEHQTDQ